ncbi:amino acid ABC transporter ATP-binding protein [Candidatus Woesearchaeota archaeon]|nr:amino acid ABC transporter ATP-binding protein [Candidatus Woesearchaeota archaeon]
MLEVNGLMKYFGEKKVFANVSFSLKKGEVLVLVGPSGCGKTTLLRCIKGLEQATKGSVTFEGRNEEIGMVFQDFNVWSHLTVLENLMIAPQIVQKRKKMEVHKKSFAALEKIGLLDKLNHYPHQMSGGQKQRVAIARSLVMNPKLLLLDEVTSSLDPELVNGIQDTIKNLAQDGMTMILVTHNLKFAREVGDKFIFLDKGESIEQGGKEIFENPKNERTKEFLQQ